MDVTFADDDLDRLETDASFTMRLHPALVKAYRKRMAVIRVANDERQLRQWKALRLEKLDGKRQHQHSIRLNDQYRLIIEILGTGMDKVVRVVGIEDYH